MKKVAELEGWDLDYWVAKACGAVQHGAYWLMDGVCGKEPFSSVLMMSFCPSSEWNYGGPIIEREKIYLVGFDVEPWSAFFQARSHYVDIYRSDCEGHGDTPLIAAMRAFVTFKFGEKVEGIPE